MVGADSSLQKDAIDLQLDSVGRKNPSVRPGAVSVHPAISENTKKSMRSGWQPTKDRKSLKGFICTINTHPHSSLPFPQQSAF